ncbi:D-alanyl-D-alanine carboxypeptidase family protein [Rubrimonas cliftonensis]|nr:D-alanyl-D-alanine carboxypeptidase family protein [Rubrimonas cliftonensis]
MAAIAAMTILVLSGAALARPTEAVLVMDARSGEVLHASNADERLHPASLTKMMTLYLVFDAIKSGQISVDQRVTVSRAAAAQPPSKIGFRPGQRVRIRELIRAAAVRSANDSAVVLAEAVSGSEAAFAKLMTRRARELGMTGTTFRNASGLTAAGHLSTARDMALLGLRLKRDHAGYFNLFGRESTPAFGRTVWNTNRLLGDYLGANGIKTGYTRAAGFNLVASAERGSKSVIVSYFGGASSKARNSKVAQLLDLGFSRSPERPRAPAGAPSLLTAVLTAPPPEPRPGGAHAGAVAAARAGDALSRGAAAIGAALTPSAANAASFDGAPAARSAGAIPAVAPTPAPNRVVAALVDPTPQAPTRAAPPAPRAGAGGGPWTLTLGAFPARETAIAELAAAALGEMPALARAGREIDVATGASGALYRARLTGLDRETADAACARLIRDGGRCEAVAPQR